jgi:ribosomal protection tetracycline resistance protein
LSRTLNLGILAHVDAGKTSLTERLLHHAGVIDHVGSVDEGNTTTDSLALERKRGITIKSAVVSFALADVTVNLIDTPGHPDFIAEVERVLSVLDGAVLVVSAVEGVQAQTRVLMRTLRRLDIPTLMFLNKIDRRGADPDRVLAAIAAKLSPAVVPMGTAIAPGTRDAAFAPYATPRREQVEVLAERDDPLLAAYLDDTVPPADRVRAALARQTGRAQVHPVYLGSAITGAGVAELGAGIAALLPAAERDADAPVSGSVFKVERGAAGEKVAYVALHEGTIRLRDRVPFGDGKHGKVTAAAVFTDGTAAARKAVVAGEIGKVWGLRDIRIGDAVGRARTTAGHHFAPPTLETVVVPERPQDRGALHPALVALAEQDPLINLRHDEVRKEISVSLYGEVQKEVIGATLADEFGVDVTFRESTTICVERPAGSGSAYELLSAPTNPFLAQIGLRVDPAPPGAGVAFRLEVELGSMPYAFFKAVEETVPEVLSQGLHGWQVPDCVVTMTHAAYYPRQSHAHQKFDKSMSSTAGDFRLLTPLILMTALRRAGTVVHEPMHRFRLEIPADTLGTVLPALARLRAVPAAPEPLGTRYVVTGDVPAGAVHELQQLLPSWTRGEGVLEHGFDHYEPVTGPVPSRPRTDHNPLDRKEYLLQVQRRVVGAGAG